LKSLLLQNISVTPPGAGKPLFADLSLDVRPGDIVTVMGASGSGKSTLLAYIGGHLGQAFQTSGKIMLGETNVTVLPPARRCIGLLFQDDLLFPHLSVGDNLAFGLAAHISGRQARQASVRAALESADLAGFQDRDPASLSGGQRARVALMRTLLSDPKALLLDEPFSKLDPELRQDFRQFVFSHARQRQLPVLMVTHDETDAIAAGGRTIAL
jgi:putative thiamine transport system ATP-binding protein